MPVCSKARQVWLCTAWLKHPRTHNQLVHFWSFDRKTYTWSWRKSSHSWNPADFTREIRRISWNPWNPADFMKSLKSGGFTLKSVKSGGFHPDITCEIHPNYKSKCFSKNSSVDECRVGDFTLEIPQISPWNLADFTQISPVKSTQNYKSKCFSKNSSVWWMQGGAMTKDFMKFTLKSGGFHPWNLADFTQISPVKSTQMNKSKCFSKNSSVWWMQGGGFHPEIWWISTMNSGGFHLWNPPKIIKASVSAKTLQLMNAGWGFHPEIWWISPRYHLW